jgi:hypothetical protein
MICAPQLQSRGFEGCHPSKRTSSRVRNPAWASSCARLASRRRARQRARARGRSWRGATALRRTRHGHCTYSAATWTRITWKGLGSMHSSSSSTTCHGALFSLRWQLARSCSRCLPSSGTISRVAARGLYVGGNASVGFVGVSSWQAPIPARARETDRHPAPIPDAFDERRRAWNGGQSTRR